MSDIEHLQIPAWPGSVWFVGLPNGKAGPSLFSVPNRRAKDTGEWSWPDMTASERGAFRALCREALSILDRMEAES